MTLEAHDLFLQGVENLENFVSVLTNGKKINEL